LLGAVSPHLFERSIKMLATALILTVLVLVGLMRAKVMALILALVCLLVWNSPGWALFWFVIFLINSGRR